MRTALPLACSLIVALQIPAWAFADTFHWATVDDYDRPLPAAGYFYHRVGGNRGTLNDFDYAPAPGDTRYTWDNTSAVSATVMQQPGSWTWGGMFTSLIRDDRDNIPLNFDAVFGPYVQPAPQGEIVAIEIVIKAVSSPTNNAALELKVEAKNTVGPPVAPSPWILSNLPSLTYPYTFTIDLSTVNLGNIETILWVIDKARLSDVVTIDRVRLRVRTTDLPVADEAFLWSYAWLMANYDPTTGMVQDRSNFQAGTFENVSATGKAAKVVAYAALKGITDSATAQTAITKIADTLLTKVPRGPAGQDTLWPHFTTVGGLNAAAGSEWASGDTAYAALDVMAALQMIGDPLGQLPACEQFLRAINWQALLQITGNQTISHGYAANGTPLAAGWDAFGMETIGVNWAYASATGGLADMLPPPSFNGSGFIDNAHYPIVLSGTDRWGNDWDVYRSQMAATQVGWYTPAKNPFLAADGLFGLSAAESPEADDPTLPAAQQYRAYGVGGMIPADDGNAEVIALHYSGMIADLRPADAARVWQVLRDRGDLTPLSNIESLRVNKTTGAKTTRHFKGSWNLALQAEGWAMADPAVRSALLYAVEHNNFLNHGYALVRGWYVLHLGVVNGADVFPQAPATQPHYSGAASALMALTHLDPAYAQTQSYLYNAYHFGPAGTEMDQAEVAYALNTEAPPAYHFSALTDTDQLTAVRRLIHWIDYPVPGAAVANVPVLVPTDGAYNWKVVRGFVSDRDPFDPSDVFSIPNVTVYGLWLNDPKVSGLGSNVYLTGTEFAAIHDPISGLYLSVAEPPLDWQGAMRVNAASRMTLSASVARTHPASLGLVRLTKTQGRDAGAPPRPLHWRDIPIPEELRTDDEFAGIFSRTRFQRMAEVTDLDAGTTYRLAIFTRRTAQAEPSVGVIADRSGVFRQASWSAEGPSFPKLSGAKARRIARRVLGDCRALFSRASLVWSREFGTSRFQPSYAFVVRLDPKQRRHQPGSELVVYVHQDGTVLTPSNEPQPTPNPPQLVGAPPRPSRPPASQ